MSETVPQIKSYYETYWSAGKQTFSGSTYGYAPNFRRWMSVELRDLPATTPVIEVGCGDASFTTDLARHFSNVTAIDISAGQIAENIKAFPGIKFLQHDVSERFPFPDASFEVVWCSEVLEHLFDPEFALREMHRILRPGGRLLVTVPYHGRFKNLLIALFKWDVHFAPSNPHIRFYTNNTLSRITRTAGFGSIRIQTCGMGQPLRDFFVPTNILLRATKEPAPPRK
ncbi:MAG: class I SAM-dependent methyltransferase [Verrucomicrobia bacterium]|nr:class I SAM-dependent methyltransferase [Verrucomicrobiota bacterium]